MEWIAARARAVPLAGSLSDAAWSSAIYGAARALAERRRTTGRRPRATGARAGLAGAQVLWGVCWNKAEGRWQASYRTRRGARASPSASSLLEEAAAASRCARGDRGTPDRRGGSTRGRRRAEKGDAARAPRRPATGRVGAAATSPRSADANGRGVGAAARERDDVDLDRTAAYPPDGRHAERRTTPRASSLDALANVADGASVARLKTIRRTKTRSTTSAPL